MAGWSSMTVSELKAELKKRGLDTTGLKAELVKRLEAAGEPEEEEEEEEEEKAPKKRTRAAASKATAKSKAKKKQKSTKGKEADDEEEEEAPAVESHKKAGEALKAAAEAEKAKGKKGVAKVDDVVPGYQNYRVYQDYDAMLNQTNIGQNNNKFYRIQLLTNVAGTAYSVWNRWGRVGERGQNALKACGGDVKKAIAEFEKKFKDKTGNLWSGRDSFTPRSGKYTLIEMCYDDDDVPAGAVVSLPAEPSKPKRVRACTLHARTKELIDLIFSHDMFKQALATMKIDTNKMPLGKISKSQIAKGYEVLEELLAEIKGKARGGEIAALSSRFYTIIPHSFGRAVPPPIRSEEAVKEKIDLLGVLGDIAIAQGLIKGGEDKEAGLDEVDHPSDANYKLLNTDLVYLDPKDPEHKDELAWIEKYTVNTQGYRKCKIIDVFRVTRRSEPARFAQHNSIVERKMLWHGTKVPVIVAILSGGLRIMPHAGGRVGCGLYFASENGKSSAYVGTADKNIGVMFLNEVALGKEKHITRDDPSLKAAPPGFDSVVAQGRTEPDPKEDIVRKFDGKDVVIPQGKPIVRPEYNNSNFAQTEYLVYKESQVHIRYLLKMQF